MKTLIASFFLLCQLVENPVHMNFDEENPYDNGYPEARYHLVLNEVLSLFGEKAALRGGTFHILRDWTDGAVNAWAWRMGDEHWIEVPGGMARYHLITEEGFIATLCHEAGHLFAGSPHRQSISLEGQADYYSTMKCMEEVFERLGYAPSKPNLNCEGHYCEERLKGASSLTSYYAEIAKVPAPDLNTPDLSIARKTITNHPKPQCRFDTMVAGIRCGNRDEFSYENSIDGACSGNSQRPLCWFNPAR